uniref:N-formylglutamate amidohydrolase n=1 Tax=Methylibium sp. TaxID=2067992 RepID=UPI001823F154
MDRLLITCEHGGRRVPPRYRALFAEHGALLETHRGWDFGALQLAREMAAAFGAPLHASSTTRLLIDLNRSIGHRQLYSEATRALSAAERAEIASRYHQPHRDRVLAEVQRALEPGRRVVHIASHSFTPVWDGVVRNADVGLLYDPARPSEVLLAARWRQALARRCPGLNVRRNYPYAGRGDGLTALLRRHHPAEAYVGIELEVNQRHVLRGGRAWAALRGALIATLREALDGATPPGSVPERTDAA